MKIEVFKECNSVYAKNQPEYLPLPAHRTDDGIVTSCWRLTFIERLKVMVAGKIFVKVMTFNNPLQPIKVTIDKEICEPTQSTSEATP